MSDTITLSKNNIVEAIVLHGKGIAVIILGIAILFQLHGLPPVTEWNQTFGMVNGLLNLVLVISGAIIVLVGLLLFDVAGVEYKMNRMEEKLIKEIRECHNLEDNQA